MSFSLSKIQWLNITHKKSKEKTICWTNVHMQLLFSMGGAATGIKAESFSTLKYQQY